MRIKCVIGCLSLAVVSVTACGESKPNKTYAQAVAPALDKSSSRSEAHKQEEVAKKLKEKAAAEATAAREEAFAKLIAVPEQKTTDLASACTEAGAAYDAFRQTRVKGVDLDRWNAIKGRDLENLHKKCTALGTIQVPACQAHAFANAPATVVDSDSVEIFKRCEEKFAGGAVKTAAK